MKSHFCTTTYKKACKFWAVFWTENENVYGRTSQREGEFLSLSHDYINLVTFWSLGLRPLFMVFDGYLINTLGLINRQITEKTEKKDRFYLLLKQKPFYVLNQVFWLIQINSLSIHQIHRPLSSKAKSAGSNAWYFFLCRISKAKHDLIDNVEVQKLNLARAGSFWTGLLDELVPSRCRLPGHWQSKPDVSMLDHKPTSFHRSNIERGLQEFLSYGEWLYDLYDNIREGLLGWQGCNWNIGRASRSKSEMLHQWAFTRLYHQK